MIRKLVFALKLDDKTGKYKLIDPPPDERHELYAEMVEEIFLPAGRYEELPRTITIILHLDPRA
jgi:hypothetical protein